MTERRQRATSFAVSLNKLFFVPVFATHNSPWQPIFGFNHCVLCGSVNCKIGQGTLVYAKTINERANTTCPGRFCH